MDRFSSLTSLAMLQVKTNEGSDYFNYLQPFALHVLATSPPTIINDKNVADKIAEHCGLKFPRHAIQIVLKRLARDKVIQKEDGIYKVTGQLEQTPYETSKAACSRTITSVLNSLRDFSQTTSFSLSSNDEAMEAILFFLKYFSIQCLKMYHDGSPIPDVGKIGGRNNWKLKLVSKYVQSINETNPEKLDHFVMVIKGNMLANALVSSDLQTVSSTYERVTFYLDTPLLIQVLGLEGEEKLQSATELLSQITALKGKLVCFSHSFDELTNVIKYAAENLDNLNASGEIILESRRSNKQKSDLILVVEDATNLLAEKNIYVERTPIYDPEYQIDEEDFSEVLQKHVNHRSDKARDYDINSVRSIYVLRNSSTPRAIEDCRAVFVTNNADYACAAYEYGQRFESTSSVCACSQ